MYQKFTCSSRIFRNMIAASAAARAHHVREHEKHSREEAFRRSQLIHGDGDGQDLQAAEEPYKPLAAHYLLVPFKDCDYEPQDGQVSYVQYHFGSSPGTHSRIRLIIESIWPSPDVNLCRGGWLFSQLSVSVRSYLTLQQIFG